MAESPDPRTAADCARSQGPAPTDLQGRGRRGGLRHGIAAETVVTEEERRIHDDCIRQLNERFTPDHVVEADLVRRVAVARARLLRCEAARESRLDGDAREALQLWEDKRRHAIRRRAQRLAADPSGTLEALEQSAFGCDWLIGRWKALDAPLAAARPWSPAELIRALRLCGIAPDPEGAEPHPTARPLRQLASAGPIEAPEADRPDVDPSATAGPPDGADPVPGAHAPLGEVPYAALRRFVAERIAWLHALRDELWEAVDGPEREAVRKAALADTDESSRYAHRFEREAELSYLRNLNAIMKVRAEARRASEAARKELHASAVQREHVGDGWYRSPDAALAPPGFRRVRAVVPGPRSTEQSGAPRPGGPIVPAPPIAPSAPKPQPPNELRNEPASSAASDPRRTLAHPEAHPGAPPDRSPRPAVLPGSTGASESTGPDAPAGRHRDVVRAPITIEDLRSVAIGRAPGSSGPLDGHRLVRRLDRGNGRLGGEDQRGEKGR